MPIKLMRTQIWLLSPQLSVALLGMLRLGVDLLAPPPADWLVALVGLASRPC